MVLEPFTQKMFSRRNWLLRCSILINLAVLLYIASHLVIGDRNNNSGTDFVLRNQKEIVLEEHSSKSHDNLSKNQIFFSEDKLSHVEVMISPIPIIDNSNFLSQHSHDVGRIAQAEVEHNINIIDSLASTILDENVNINNNSVDNYFPSIDEKAFEQRLLSVLKCIDRSYDQQILQRGDFWVLQNYVRAEHGSIKCHESITYTTHADYTFLDNIIPLLKRWNSPLSIALHAPGTDFEPTLDSVRYLRDCHLDKNLVRKYVTFHLYFSTKHMPKYVPK